ncbi:MAG: hypothetical protein ACREFX_10680 [Opitutaceae bacterium]
MTKVWRALRFPAIAALGLGLLGVVLRAQDRSPFLPPSGQAGGPGGRTEGPNGIELRGVMSTSVGTTYNFYNPSKRTSVWLALNQSADGILVKAADPRRDSATIDVNGQIVPLTLKASKIGEAPIMGPGNIPIVLNPTPADELRRLQAVADEVRRRRLLREQAERNQERR